MIAVDKSLVVKYGTDRDTISTSYNLYTNCFSVLRHCKQIASYAVMEFTVDGTRLGRCCSHLSKIHGSEFDHPQWPRVHRTEVSSINPFSVSL